MSSKSEKKRLSDVTNAATAAETKQKKAKGKQTQEKHWKAFSPYLELANKDKVDDLVKKLFQELWKTNGEEAATAITIPFVKEVKTERKKIQGLAGTWETEEGGTLTLSRGIQSARFSDDGVNVWNLELQSSPSDDEWVYTSNNYEWFEVPRNVKHLNVEMNLWYDPNDDTIEGRIEIGPIPPRAMCGSSIEFTAERKSD